ncbi:MAG TPA: hypothetical protein VFR37_11865 [Longimicrobium sp.]|nr:hypothetical protein [Longimicrobium sp.]
MFGLEILDVVIGLMFVYLLLALLATALNEYVSAVLNLRGKELARGLSRLLEDVDEQDAAKRALNGLRKQAAAAVGSLTEQFYSHPLIRPLATHGLFSNKPRLPSYIPARTFAMALLDTLGAQSQDAALPAADAAAGTAGPAAGRPDARAQLVKVLEILKRESPQDVIERLGDLSTLLGKAELPDEVKARLVNAVTGTQTQLQKLHDSVEVWFNNAMDRVSGAYKRNVQAILLLLGALIATAMNADTIQMWRQLAENDELRTAMVQHATATLPTVDSIINSPPENPLTVEEARARYDTARALVEGMDLQLGWSSTGPMSWPEGFGPGVLKILGLLFTALAISLGAPFWFDMLNRVISIRATGRAPDEKPKSPQGPPKRAAEDTPK